MRDDERMFAVIATAILLLLIVAIVQWIWRGIVGLFAKAPIEPVDEDGPAMAIVCRPVQMPGGQWMRRVFKWVECDPPREPSNPIVYGVDAPAPDHQPRYSGVSHRSN